MGIAVYVSMDIPDAFLGVRTYTFPPGHVLTFPPVIQNSQLHPVEQGEDRIFRDLPCDMDVRSRDRRYRHHTHESTIDTSAITSI